MAANLHDQIVALNECCKGGEVRLHAEKAYNVVIDLQHLLLEDVTDKELDYCASILFDKDIGAVSFLRLTLGVPEFDGSKTECLKLIHSFLRRIGKKAFSYAVEIKTICLSLFTREKAAKVKVAAYTNLIYIIEISGGSQISTDLAVKLMIEKLFGELATKDSKLSASVKRCIYALLGKCAEVYPELMITGYSDKLVEIYVRALKSEMTSKTKDFKMDIIAGCFEGLKSFQINFTQSAEEGAKFSYDIFKYARMAINPTNEMHRYLVPKAALDLFAKHADQFSQYMVDDYETMYEHLLFWSKHHNRDMLHAGLPALEAFLKEISDILVTRAREGRKEAATFKFFIQKFRRVMDNPEATSKEVSLAIKGYGYFAAPCRLFLTGEDVKFMFSDMMQRSEQIFLSIKQEELLDGERLMSLPSFVEALASIVKELNVVSDSFVMSLENLVVVLMQHFPRLNKKMHFLCFRAMVNVCLALAPQGAVFHSFLSHVVYQGLIRSFSHPVVMAADDEVGELASAEEKVDVEKPRISYRDYLPMWQSLLDNAKIKEFGGVGVDIKQRNDLTRAIYDEIITSLLKILAKLNLTSNKATDLEDQVDLSTTSDDQDAVDVTSSDPVQGLQASRPKDFQILINLVDFCIDLLPRKHCEEFVRWVYTFGHELIVRSTMYPLVSGFYKLLAVCMKMCTKTDYFKDMFKTEVLIEDSMEMDIDVKTSHLAERQFTLQLFTKFTKEVLERMKQYKDDLLAGCLSVILSLPQQIIEPQFSNIVPAIQLTLRLGLSYLPLAVAGLDALEFWFSTLPAHVLQPHYADILPGLDAYLKSTDQESEADHTISLTSVKNKASGKGQRKIPIKLLKGTQRDNKASQNQQKDSQLLQVRQRCVQLLGSLGGSYNSCLVTTSAHDIAKAAVAWDRLKHLRFEVPFMDIKPVIYFDPFLPRIVELATTSSDRQTKVAACELLHSLVLYMLGRGAQQPHGRAITFSMHALYSKVFPALLLLACDVEQVAKQLFEPLMLQLIHWFSNNRQFESEETVALLDTLMDAVESTSNTALRDFSAKCMREFLKWSIKQSSKDEMEKNPMNVKSLLKRIYSLALHPSVSKRLGAALAFNHIYTIFREEEELVNTFIFEMLVVFVDSLALAHNDEKSLGTAEQAIQVLNHLERIICHKANKLNKLSKPRRIPRNWPESSLDVAVRWMMRQCGRPQTECRHACMTLFYKMAPLLPDIRDVKMFFQTFLESDGPGYFQQRFESGLYKRGNVLGLTRYSTMPKMNKVFSLKVALQWFDLFLAPLDCYTWVFGQDLLTPAQVLSGNKSVIAEAIEFFLKKLAVEDIMSVTKLFHVKNVVVFTPREIDEYNKGKCTVIIRIFNFLSVCLSKFPEETCKVFPRGVFVEDLWQLITASVLQPATVGFNMADTEVMTKLPQEIGQLLSVLVKRLPKNTLADLTRYLSSTMKRASCNLFGMLPISFAEPEVDLVQLQYMVSGYELLHQVSLLMPSLKHAGTTEECATTLLNAVFDGVTCTQDGERAVVSLSPVPLSLSGRMLQLAFSIGVQSRQILGKILDKTPLKVSRGHSTVRHGSIFYTMYQKNINDYLIRKSREFVRELAFYADQDRLVVASVLHSMLTQAARDKTQRKQEGQELASTVVSHWTKFSSWWGEGSNQESIGLALTLLTKVIIVDSKITSDEKHGSFEAVFNMYCHLLTGSSTTISFKTKALELLPFFTSLDSEHTNRIRSCLDKVIADNFPLKSSEFIVGSPNYNSYIEALGAILSALELSGSLMILQIVISIFCRKNKHVYEEQIQNSLTRFVKRLPHDRHKLALDVPFEIFVDEGGFPGEIRRSSLERVCLPLLRIVKMPAFIEFFICHIKDIMKKIDAKQVKGSESALEAQLITKLCCYELIEVMYSRLPKEEVSSKDSRINCVYMDNNAISGKEMTTFLSKVANEAKRENMAGETSLLELRRQYHCAAYNALIAVISCTQTDLKFYTAFLFTENINKGQFLWDNLVDKNRTYNFEIEMTTPLERRKRFVSIRNEVRSNRRDDADDDVEMDYATPVHYLSSQYLQDSSLSEDVSQFDFSASAVSFSGAVERDRRRNRSQRALSAGMESNELEAGVTVTDEYVELEMDELNAHEVMATLTALLQHMRRNNVTPATQKGTSPADMPSWMTNLQKKMRSSSTSINIKMIIAKLVVNAEEVFRPYAKFWLSPLVQLVVSGGIGGANINYFIIDVVVTMLSWHTVAIPEDNSVDRAMANKLLEYLMQNCYHVNRSVLRNNLEVVKTLVEVWKARLQLPVRIIFDLFKNPDQKSKDNVTGIQLLAVMLANKLPPFSPNPDIDKDKFFKTLAMNMMNHYKFVYAPAAEVVGMAIKYLAEKSLDEDSVRWREAYMSNIEKMLSSFQMTKPDRFINCVFNLHKHYPPIADRFISRLIFLLPKMHGELRTHCLEMILTRIDHVNNVYQELKNQGLTSVLSHRDEATQHVALKIVHGMLGKLKSSDLHTLLSSVTAFSSNPSAVCRATMYDIAIWIYDNYRDDDSAEADDIMNQVKECLLKGLADEDLKNRLTIQNFWSDATRLPVDTLDRLVAMLEAMYSPNTETHYLSYATNLLLEMTSKSPDYNREIFEHPLSECKFENYSVRSSWRQRHALMTPLFVETQMSSQGGSTQSLGPGEGMETGQLRATQDVQQFTPTQTQGGSKAPYNWLTQSSLDTYADYSLPSAETQSSLLFTVGSSSKKKRTYKPVPAGFGEKRLSAGRDHPDGPDNASRQDNEILRLKKRFMKDKEASQVFFMRRQARLQKMREDIMKEQKLRRENHVTMYRKYRIGDLPDIQIKYSYIIAPLQALAQRDATLAKMLFSSIFKAIFAEIDTMKTEREAVEMVERINRCLNDMLHASTKYHAPFIACILDLAHSNTKRLKLEPGTVNTACVTSLQQPLGIVLLEDKLIQTAGDEPRPGKRSRGTTNAMSIETSTWIELARLYKSLGNLDVVRGILSCKIGTQNITKEALEYEARGDYLEACKLYSQGVECTSWPDGSPDEVEIDMWDDSRLQCVDNLGQWHKLEEWSVPVDNTNSPVLDKLWEDTYYQEHYLPFFLRGKLKLLLEGKGDQELLTFIDEAMKVKERKALLETRYCEELALMYFWQQDYDRARHYTGVAVSLFLQDWSSLDKLMTTSRSSRLQCLQKLSELQEVLNFMAHPGNLESVRPAYALLDKWLRRSPDPVIDTPNIWSDVITNRCVFIDRMSQKLRDHISDPSALDRLHEGKMALKISHASSACEQHNFHVALSQLKNTHKSVRETSDRSLMLKWTHMYAKTHHRKCRAVKMGSSEVIRVVTGTLEQLGKNKRLDVLSSNCALARQQLMLSGEAAALASDAILNSSDFEDVPTDCIGQLQTVLGCDGDTHQQIRDSFIEKGFTLLREAADLVDSKSTITESSEDRDSLNKARLTLYKYCDQYVRLQKEEDKIFDSASINAFPVSMVTSLMDAMRNGCVEARQYFPRLLQIIEIYPKTLDVFTSKTSQVPCWMFIYWISQMVALLDKKEAEAVQGILQRIADDYPQALVYPMKISSDGFDFATGISGIDKQNKAAVDKLNARLSSVPMVDKFIKALEQFGQPNALFQDWSDEMKKLLAETKRRPNEIRRCYTDMYSDLMDYPDDENDDSSQDLYGTQSQSQDSVVMGAYRRKFAKTFAKDMNKDFGRDGSKLLTMSAQDFAKKLKVIRGEMEKLVRGGRLKPPGTLKEYCTWMVGFQGADNEKDLEIPGQYLGMKKPMPEYHTTISSFDERVLVLQSIRKPKRIIIRGNDEREYKFLVKGGEDLRQDQRIEQLFAVMNDIYRRDAACRQRHLQLRTYQVIPMTPRVGLIEWMNNTVPLKNFLNEAMTEEESKFWSKKNPQTSHVQWTYKICNSDNAAERYKAVYKKYSKTETMKMFRELEAMVPYDLSRRAFLQMSASPEAFYTLKSHFAVSHALVSVSQYILGIGDRHLSNFMIDQETGGMVGIDFGHSFGSATQFLPVPELMPFRLTRQLRLLLLPLKERGVMESSMVQALQALRSHRRLLLTTMDVFIKEPSIDWLNYAEKQLNTGLSGEDADVDKAWYPKEKIGFARRKLEGDNPAYITRDELRLGHSKSTAFSAMEKIVLGEGGVNLRATLPSHGLSVEQQVACLIDQATDPNLLGRVYAGWEAWV